MKHRVGIYEAKSSLSKLLKAVKEHRVSIEISDRGKVIAEIIPAAETEDLNARCEALLTAGVISRPASSGSAIECIAKRPGALDRFIKDRE